MKEYTTVFVSTGKEVAMPRSIHRFLGSALGALLCLVFASPSMALYPPTPAAIEASAGATLLAQGIVVDPNLGMAWIMSPGGGLDAIDLGNGSTRWHSDAAARPLMLFGGLLIAQAEPLADERGLRIVALDAQRGNLLLNAETDLPQGAWNGIEAGLGKRLDVQAWRSGEDVSVAWAAERKLVQGYHDPQAQVGPPAQSTGGVLRLDLQNERLVAGNPALRAPSVPRPDVPAEHRLSAREGLQLASADGNFVVVSERVAKEPIWEKYRWTVIDRGTASVLGTTYHFASQAPFAVVDRILVQVIAAHQRRVGDEIVTEPLAVRGVDLGSGGEVWRLPLRDSDYRGPFPP